MPRKKRKETYAERWRKQHPHLTLYFTKEEYEFIKQQALSKNMTMKEYIIDLIRTHKSQQRSYMEGYDKGYKEGYQKGYEKGHQEGYDKGSKEAVKKYIEYIKWRISQTPPSVQDLVKRVVGIFE